MTILERLYILRINQMIERAKQQLSKELQRFVRNQKIIDELKCKVGVDGRN